MTSETAEGRVLLVEDNSDLRDLLTLTLENEGYAVVPVSSAAEALGILAQEQFALVVSHYNLPQKTGLAMLREAADSGHLGHTPAMIMTAHANVEAESPFPVLKKPLDIAGFIDQVRKVAAPREWTPAAAAGAPEVKAEFILYYTPPWPNSLRAHEVLQRVLRRFEANEVSVDLCDLSQECLPADEDNILFSPTLVKRWPSPPTFLVGDLGTGEALEDLLRLCGVSERPASDKKGATP